MYEIYFNNGKSMVKSFSMFYVHFQFFPFIIKKYFCVLNSFFLLSWNQLCIFIEFIKSPPFNWLLWMFFVVWWISNVVVVLDCIDESRIRKLVIIDKNFHGFDIFEIWNRKLSFNWNCCLVFIVWCILTLFDDFHWLFLV